MRFAHLKKLAEEYADLAAEYSQTSNILWGGESPILPEQSISKSTISEKSRQVISGLDSRFKPYVEKLLQIASSNGLNIELTEGYRTNEHQQELYEQGRTKPGNIVTGAKPGTSLHNYGLAVDIAFKDNAGKIYWPNEQQYEPVIQIAKSLGLTWGGDWAGQKDIPHFQYPVTMKDIMTGKFRPEK